MLSAKPLSIKCRIGDETGTFYLRRPEAHEHQSYLDARVIYNKKRNDADTNRATAAEEFFDLLVTDCAGLNMELADGSIHPFNKDTPAEMIRQIKATAKNWFDLIPTHAKNNMIYALFEDAEVIVDEKK